MSQAWTAIVRLTEVTLSKHFLVSFFSFSLHKCMAMQLVPRGSRVITKLCECGGATGAPQNRTKITSNDYVKFT